MQTILKDILYPYADITDAEWFQKLDAYLCIYLRPLWLRLWWHRLWIRSDEFHPSLGFDLEVASVYTQNWPKLSIYTNDLAFRRMKAHQTDLRTA